MARACDSGKAKLKFLYPDDMPLVEKVRIIAREIYRARDIEVPKPVREQLANFDELLQQLGEQSGDRRHSPESHLLLQRSIEQALRRLNDREQRVVQLYYEFDLSLKEIARVLDITEARVCQINKLALRKLRELLQ